MSAAEPRTGEAVPSAREGAGDRLYRKMREHGPLCVGIDPHPGLLVDWGLSDDAAGLETFARTVVAAAAGRAASIKPQVALFERHGSAGLRVLETVFAEAHEAGLEIVADAKRGDIGSTMAAYADAWLSSRSPLAADTVTLSPYLGFESLRPALDLAEDTGRGTFVLALTSNPEGASVQHVGAEPEGAGAEDAAAEEGAVARRIVAAAQRENAARTWANAGPCGLVVGATVGDALDRLGIAIGEFNGLVLAPGYGAQGATVSDLTRTFAGCMDRLVVPSSRGILRHGPQETHLARVVTENNSDLRHAAGI